MVDVGRYAKPAESNRCRDGGDACFVAVVQVSLLGTHLPDTTQLTRTLGAHSTASVRFTRPDAATPCTPSPHRPIHRSFPLPVH